MMDKSSLLWIFVITACTVGSSHGTKRSSDACSPQEACSMWWKHSNGQTDSSHLCDCANDREPACNANWEQNSGAVLTYRSLENRDETHQYQFCKSVVGGSRTCEGNETAAILRVSYNPYAISLEESFCRCPSNRTYEWVSAQDGEGFQLQNYTCEKPDCASNDTICGVVEKSSNQMKDRERKSLCNCQPGKGCDYENPVEKENDNTIYYKCSDIPHTG